MTRRLPLSGSRAARNARKFRAERRRRIHGTDRKCDICGTPIDPDTHAARKRCTSIECRRAAQRQANTRFYPRLHRQRVAARAVRSPRHCTECGELIPPETHGNRRTCVRPECQQAATRTRNLRTRLRAAEAARDGDEHA